ncbi:MAG: hypothetical protein J5382_03775 [Bacteroidales bacterium]|nr:hypothetical protein [Bacteroidales bacterium]
MANTSATYEEVKAFLDRMRIWLTVMGGQVLYDTRDKNEQFMADMEWNKPDKKREWLLKLEPDDYYEGPDPNEILGCNPIWKFGKRIEGRLCYIKVFLIPHNNVYCISFHFAEHDMYLPLKNTIETI